MAVWALGLELLMYPIFLNLVGHLSRVLRACEVILAENNKDVFVNNASEAVSRCENKSVREKRASTSVSVSACLLHLKLHSPGHRPTLATLTTTHLGHPAPMCPGGRYGGLSTPPAT